MIQQFEFGDWVQVRKHGEWFDARYCGFDPASTWPHDVYIPMDGNWEVAGSDSLEEEEIRPHPTKKRDAFATLTVQNPSPNVLTAIALDHAKAVIELAIKANNGGFNA